MWSAWLEGQHLRDASTVDVPTLSLPECPTSWRATQREVTVYRAGLNVLVPHLNGPVSSN